MDTVTRPHATLSALLRDPPAYEAKSPWRPIPALIAAFVICFVAVAVLGMSVLIAAVAMGTFESDLDKIAENMTEITKPEGITVMILSQLASLAAVWLLAGWRDMRRDVLRLNPPKPGWGLSIAFGLGLVVVSGAIEFLLYSVSQYDAFADSKWLTEGLRSPLWWGVIIIAVVLAPLWEELTFRGFLLSSLAQTRLGFWGAALVVNTAWTALHATYSVPGLISVFAAGLMLTWLVWRTGAIRPAVVAHAVFNLSAVLFSAYFAPGGVAAALSG